MIELRVAYLLDTNVLSELRKGLRGSPSVLAWHRRTPANEKFVSVLTLGELRRGAERVRWRDPQITLYLEQWILAIVRDYADTLLSIDLEVADLWGRLCPTQPLPAADGLLAATALHHDLTLVTRNVADVARSGVRLFNPFALPA